MIIGKTKMCCVGKCDKEAVKHDGFLLKSRDAVSAGFCEHHWFLIQCPNFRGIKNCFGVFDKGLGLVEKRSPLTDDDSWVHDVEMGCR